MLARLLGSIHVAMPEHRASVIARLLVQRARLRLRGLRFTPRPASAIDPRVLLESDLTWAASAGLSMFDILAGAEFQSRNLYHALNAGEPARIARALAWEAAHTSNAGASGVAADVAPARRSAHHCLADRRSACSGHDRHVGRDRGVHDGAVAVGARSTGSGRRRAAVGLPGRGLGARHGAHLRALGARLHGRLRGDGGAHKPLDQGGRGTRRPLRRDQLRQFHGAARAPGGRRHRRCRGGGRSCPGALEPGRISSAAHDRADDAGVHRSVSRRRSRRRSIDSSPGAAGCGPGSSRPSRCCA